MSQEQMAAIAKDGKGFIAALDQSGGSTPGALRAYGVADGSYEGDAEMFRLIHEMRVRIITAPAFTGEKVIGAILFEQTMDGEVNGKPVPRFLWEDRSVVPFLKVDKGVEAETDGNQLLKPIPDLEKLLERAAKLGVFGTKMRSVVRLPSRDGIRANVERQFEFGARISKAGLVPIIEPEVLIKSPDKKGAERILLEELTRALDKLPSGERVMLKLTIPDEDDLYRPLTEHEAVTRVVALSGGYPLSDACARLKRNTGVIASFSRALAEELRQQMSDAEFDAALQKAVDEIYDASVHKV